MIDYAMMVKALVLACAVAVGCASTLFFKMRNDNPIEQTCESLIKSQSGVEVDLTPEVSSK